LKRKALLKRILRRTKHNRIRFTDHVVGEGLALFAELEQRNLEGMDAKNIDSKYTGGRTRNWLKIKTAAGRKEMANASMLGKRHRSKLQSESLNPEQSFTSRFSTLLRYLSEIAMAVQMLFRQFILKFGRSTTT
jgi:hypothetical protein